MEKLDHRTQEYIDCRRNYVKSIVNKDGFTKSQLIEAAEKYEVSISAIYADLRKMNLRLTCLEPQKIEYPIREKRLSNLKIYKSIYEFTNTFLIKTSIYEVPKTKILSLNKLKDGYIIYFVCDDFEIIYIGYTKIKASRFYKHIAIEKMKFIYAIEVPCLEKAGEIETKAIKYFQPILNKNKK